LAAAREALAGEKTFEDLATELNLEIEESTPFGSNGPVGSLGQATAVAAAALELETGDLGGPLVHENSAILFEVTERQRFDPVAFADAKEQTRATVREQKLNLIIGSLVSQRREELGVRYDSQLLESLQPAAEPVTGT
jgi:hypothetical protein